MITTEKIKIFNSYGGDVDGLARVGNDYQKNLFDNNDWSLIDNLYQDIELINKGLVAQVYIDQTFVKLKENCDSESFENLSSKIVCYKDFQKVAEILKRVKSLVSIDSDTVWSRFDSTAQFLDDLNQDIANIENCNFSTLDKVRMEFGPTSSYQEISISNGWGEEFLKLAEAFDKLFEKLAERKTAHNSTLPKAGRSWLQKLFGS